MSDLAYEILKYSIIAWLWIMFAVSIYKWIK